MSDSDSSSLSSAPESDDEVFRAEAVEEPQEQPDVPEPKPASTPKARKRSPSPPHTEVLADNPDIAFLVMFRSRFSDALPPKLPHFGPQDIERGVVDPVPSPSVEGLLCALLGLVLNRKKYIERGHYGRALEEAIQTQKSQWPKAWNGISPISGGKTFNNMTPQQRIYLLRTLVMWALQGSDAVRDIIKGSYKQARVEGDLNQSLSVQYWGQDRERRRYYLVEGQDDTYFRLYREGDRTLKNITWRSMGGSIEELNEVAGKLEKDGSQGARRLASRIQAAVPRFEATEEKRKRREYRQARKAQFTRPEPGYSMYEGRTRGKRMKYTFSDDEDYDSDMDGTSLRRSTRQPGRTSPDQHTGPTVTASGRQVRSRVGGAYGESLLSGQQRDTASPDELSADMVGANGTGRPSRSAATNGWAQKGDHIEGYNSVDEMDEEEDAASSGEEWNDGDEDLDDGQSEEDEDEALSADEISETEVVPDSLVVRLKYGKKKESTNAQDPSPQPTNGYHLEEGEGKKEIAPSPLQHPINATNATNGAQPPSAPSEVALPFTGAVAPLSLQPKPLQTLSGPPVPGSLAPGPPAPEPPVTMDQKHPFPPPNGTFSKPEMVSNNTNSYEH